MRNVLSQKSFSKLWLFMFILLAPCALAPAARAQSAANSMMAPSGKGNVVSNVVPPAVEVSFRATIKAIDPATREITLMGASGETAVIAAGPAVRLALLKVGDIVDANYYRSVAFVLSAPGQPVPPSQIKAAMARPVSAPGGVLIKETVISARVVGIDLAANSLQLVRPSGGEVITVEVTDPVRQAHLKYVKIGDTLTTVVSEALAISVTPAK